MAHLIEAQTLSEAWRDALELLVESGGKVVNLNVVFSGGCDEIETIRRPLDEHLSLLAGARRRGQIWGVQTVASTIFPSALYHPHLGDEAAPRLYESHARAMTLAARRRSWQDRDNYFNRLVAYPAVDGSAYNQLTFLVDRITRQLSGRAPKSSAYEMGVTAPIDGELRVQSPSKDRQLMGFPCLSHVSLTIVNRQISATALYRNQSFITRAYGNYLGLARLVSFLCRETNCELGEIEVVASHADGEIARGARSLLRQLLPRAVAQ